MYFGGPNGFVRFNPKDIKDNAFIPPIVITAFKKFNKDAKLDTVITEKKLIELGYDENNISFEFAALNFSSPQKNQYAYKLEGLDKDWVYSGTRRFAAYPNLDPGEYVFRVKGSNNDGVWNEEGISIAIIIYPPWWKTWWAYSAYALLFIFALFGIRRYELNRLHFKNQVKLDKVVLKEKEETDKMKSRFFANISHEFRTPLTLILGPAEKISSDTSDDIKKDANIIKRNSRRLLQLINQLLDLSKLESGRLKLEASKGNIVSFVKGVALSFESLAESKDISLKLLPEKEFIEMYFDKEKMMQILTNILSNAFKFTPEEGKIEVKVNLPTPKSPPEEGTIKGVLSPPTEGRGVGQKKVNWDNYVSISIRDTGIGIPQEEIPKLFDRFYQVDSSHTREYEGTGIGLALTKELVELHHGTINVESVKNEWTEFTLEFPLGREHLKDEEIIEDKTEVIPGEARNLIVSEQNKNQVESILGDSTSKTPQNDDEVNTEKTIILVVEDNYDMRQYIRESLDGNYLIEEAVNGDQGVRKAEKIIPDLIVSDLMMPKMDGNELVKRLKNDEKTSHIPIILLTAKAGQENKLEGLETGADDYLTKPFDIKELQVRIKNLITIRKKLQEKFSKINFQLPFVKEHKFSGIDEKFMIKVGEVIEKHISEEDFSIEDFGSEVGMSRMQLHRKLKALTGKSASRYIRSIKLEKGKRMIEAKEGNISEIAYSLGFGSPTYFTRCFKEEFGYTPSEL
jgi:signal transduction histidine kinase/DNA-binding response OmpR family regulator